MVIPLQQPAKPRSHYRCYEIGSTKAGDLKNRNVLHEYRPVVQKRLVVTNTET
jgi:hypothetical protein